MFTGIISDVGQVLEITPHGELNRLVLASAYDPGSIALGASIAVNGVCLTAVEAAPANPGARSRSTSARDAQGHHARPTEGGRQGQSRTFASDRRRTRRAHGQRPCRRRRRDPLAPRFRRDGAFPLSRAETAGEVYRDQRLRRARGTSLTVNAVDDEAFEVLLIPHTLAVTAWGALKAGDNVNIEVDQMARYAARLIEAGGMATR